MFEQRKTKHILVRVEVLLGNKIGWKEMDVTHIQIGKCLLMLTLVIQGSATTITRDNWFTLVAPTTLVGQSQGTTVPGGAKTDLPRTGHNQLRTESLVRLIWRDQTVRTNELGLVGISWG